jgi:hypothetical protein
VTLEHFLIMDNTWAKSIESGYTSPQPKGTEGVSATEVSNKLGTALEEWWNSDACKKLQEASEQSVQKAVGKYHMLSSEDKYDMVQAICYIMCDAEKEGVSHRGLQDALGIYPEGFWITELMDVHNALWSEFQKRKNDAELDREVKLLQDFTET